MREKSSDTAVARKGFTLAHEQPGKPIRKIQPAVTLGCGDGFCGEIPR
jgi:hypothetical protein